MSVADRDEAQAQEARRASLSWLAVSLVDGRPICDLPYLQADGLEYRLMEGTTQQLRLPYDCLPANWQDATLPGGVAYILTQDEQPVWGGLLVGVHEDLAGTGLELKVDTVETYLEQCPTGELSYRGQGQTLIVADIVRRGAVDGMRNCLAAEYEPSPVLRNREYQDTDDKSVLSAIQELAGVDGGPEWGHWWRMEPDGSYRCVISAADHYGSMEPVTEFDVSQMTGFSLDLDASGTALANRVRAVSTADGDTRPSSSWVSYEDPSRPVWPLSYTPSTSIKDVTTLEAHARRRLASRRTGTVTHSIDLDLLSAPRLGVEWRPGDTVRWDAGGAESLLPGGASGMARVIGYRISFTGSWTLTPILQEGAVEYE
ncbi:hypothetical protein DKK73_05185 [Bifidobacterium asteroides]|nr:hypothetical protein DKK73_05185 [Bifidobacterium asteroides]